MAIATESQFHVLAVDDSLIDRKLIERLLKTSSFQVTTVDSGSKALEFLGLQDEKATPPSSSPPPDQHVDLLWSKELEVNLIITDYCMPGMTGYELLKKVKESSSLKDIPVVIMSSENVPSRINRCLEGGAEEFLLKPVKLSDMSRLRPHILKGMNKDQQQQQQQQLPNNSVTSSSNNNSSSSSNKRKAMDECVSAESLSPERTRQRFSNGSSLTVL